MKWYNKLKVFLSKKTEDKMAYNVLDVSRYIVHYSSKEKYEISNLKLQKLLYFVQAYFLICKNEPCFNEAIEAWAFGPVVPVACHEFKGYGSTNIPDASTYLVIDEEHLWNVERKKYDDSMISEEDKELINAVVDNFKNYIAVDLIKLTHQQAPWTKAYSPYKNNEITLNEIKEYFSEQQEVTSNEN